MKKIRFILFVFLNLIHCKKDTEKLTTQLKYEKKTPEKKYQMKILNILSLNQILFRM